MNQQILVGAIPMVGESLHSLLRRIAAENMLTGVGDILRAVGLSGVYPVMPGEVAALARMCRLPPDVVGALCPGVPARDRATQTSNRRVSYFGSRVPADQLHMGKWEKICPSCIRERGYVSGANAFKFMTVCPVHGRRLLDQCQSCEQPINALRRLTGRCDCGAELGGVETPEGSPGELRVAQVIRRAWLQPFSPELPRLSTEAPGELLSLNIEDLLDVLSFLYRLEGATRQNSSSGASSMQIRHVAWRVDRIGHSLSNWPRAFHEQLARTRTSLLPSSRWERMNGAGSVSYRLFAELPGSQFSFLHRAYLGFIERRSRRSIR